MPQIDTHNPTYVGVSGAGNVITVVNNGNVPILYQDATKGGTISASIFDGSLGAGATLIYPTPLFLLGSASSAQADISNGAGVAGISTAQKQLIQLAIIAEHLAEGLGTKQANLDYPHNTAGL